MVSWPTWGSGGFLVCGRDTGTAFIFAPSLWHGGIGLLFEWYLPHIFVNAPYITNWMFWLDTAQKLLLLYVDDLGISMLLLTDAVRKGVAWRQKLLIIWCYIIIALLKNFRNSQQYSYPNAASAYAQYSQSATTAQQSYGIADFSSGSMGLIYWIWSFFSYSSD